jgi:hypothetical protein
VGESEKIPGPLVMVTVARPLWLVSSALVAEI